LFWLVLVCAMGLGWWVDRSRLSAVAELVLEKIQAVEEGFEAASTTTVIGKVHVRVMASKTSFPKVDP
jgi:hypothetical protein